MSNIHFLRKSSVRKNFFLNSIRVPTEFQLNTWENEGGSLFGAGDDAVIVNGVLCRNWRDKLEASVRPHWQTLKGMFGIVPKK
jgi:hypothetical protein